MGQTRRALENKTENNMMLMLLSYLRDKVNFCLSLCLIKDAEELENLGEKGNKTSFLCKEEFNIRRLLTLEKEGLNRIHPRHMKILNDEEKRNE